MRMKTKRLLAAISLSALLMGGVSGCGKVDALTGKPVNSSEVTTQETNSQGSSITYRWEEVRKQLGEDRATKLKDTLKHSQDVIDAWGYGTHEGREGIGFDLYPDVVLDLLKRDFDQFKALFGSELQKIQALTPKGERFLKDINGLEQNPIPDDTSAMLFDINKAYEGAIAEMNAQVHPTPGTNNPDFTRTPAVRTEFEHARDVFQRCGYYLFGGELQGFQKMTPTPTPIIIK